MPVIIETVYFLFWKQFLARILKSYWCPNSHKFIIKVYFKDSLIIYLVNVYFCQTFIEFWCYIDYLEGLNLLLRNLALALLTICLTAYNLVVIFAFCILRCHISFLSQCWSNWRMMFFIVKLSDQTTFNVTFSKEIEAIHPSGLLIEKVSGQTIIVNLIKDMNILCPGKVIYIFSI